MESATTTELEAIAKNYKFGPISVEIKAPDGIIGKTRIQLIISKALKDAGYDVECMDTLWGINASRWQRQVGSLYGEHLGETEACKVSIDVTTK
mgnify:CR=1 FL=1